jgi:hypothetical protein
MGLGESGLGKFGSTNSAIDGERALTCMPYLCLAQGRCADSGPRRPWLPLQRDSLSGSSPETRPWSIPRRPDGPFYSRTEEILRRLHNPRHGRILTLIQFCEAPVLNDPEKHVKVLIERICHREVPISQIQSVAQLDDAGCVSRVLTKPFSELLGGDSNLRLVHAGNTLQRTIGFVTPAALVNAR